MPSVAISSKGDNYPENNKSTQEITNRKIIQIGAYTVPTRGQRIASREIKKMKYNTDGSLHYTNLGSKDRIPNGSLHCTNEGPEDRIPRNDKMTYDTKESLHCIN
jgi:hypothetical protein